MGTKCLANDENPFEGLNISESWVKLHEISDRTICPKCHKSRKYFCYTCFIPVSEIEQYVPHVQLPFKIDIIKHSREIDGKSTATHAAVLCPNDVMIYTYPSIPDYDTAEKIILVFPSSNAVSVEYLIKSLSVDATSKEAKHSEMISRVVFIDSTWNQTRGIYKDPRLSKLPCVVLKNRITQFWRHQNGVPRWHLSTIEAIHQFFLEYDDVTRELEKEKFNGDISPRMNHLPENNCSTSLDTSARKYDNLLFFFRFMYDKIHTLYDHDTLRSYKRPLQ